jgi:hypothetical protein
MAEVATAADGTVVKSYYSKKETMFGRRPRAKLFLFGGNWSDQENGGSWGNSSSGVDYTRPTAGITDGVTFFLLEIKTKAHLTYLTFIPQSWNALQMEV